MKTQVLAARGLAAVAVLVSGYVHLHLLVSDGYMHPAYIGIPFIINVVSAVIIAVALMAWRSGWGIWAPPLLAIGFGVVNLIFLIIALGPGLGVDHEQLSGANGMNVKMALISEIVAVIAAAAALLMSGVLSPNTGGTRRTATGKVIAR